MTPKEEALNLKNYEEYEKKIDELYEKGLVIDNDIIEHFSTILPKAYNPYDKENDIIWEIPGLGKKENSTPK